MTNRISMSGIARLAGVARSTVSMWRKRYGVSSDVPFPEPLNCADSDVQLMFDASEVAQWLVATSRSEGRDVVGDAPFYSSLFDQVLDDAVQSAALLEHWDAAEAECFETSTSLSELVEAAFGPRLVLEKLQDQVWLDHPEKLHNAGAEIITTALYEIINSRSLCSSYPTPTVVPWGPGSVNIIVNLARRYSDEVPFQVLCLPDNSNTVACEVAWSEIRSRGIVRRENELPANAVIVGVWLQLESSEVKGFFETLDDLLLNLDSTGLAIIIAPAELLLEKGKSEKERRSFLSYTVTGDVASLRYSARLPRSWAINLGQRQLALWIFKKPNSSGPHSLQKFPIVIAELSGLTAKNRDEVVSDIVTVALFADEMRKHSFFNSQIALSTDILRDDKLTFDSLVLGNRAQQKVSGDLLALADQAGLLVPDDLLFADGNVDSPGLQRITWRNASTGKARVLEVLPGMKIQEKELFARGPGTVPVIGKEEMVDLGTIGKRRIDRLRLEEIVTNTRITEPGDVVFFKSQKPKAFIDHHGGHVVKAPVQIARCRSTFGRSSQLLHIVTTPYFVANAINSAFGRDDSSWTLTVLDRARSDILLKMHQFLQEKRDELLAQLAALDKFEQGYAAALASKSIHAGKNVTN